MVGSENLVHKTFKSNDGKIGDEWVWPMTITDIVAHWLRSGIKCSRVLKVNKRETK